MYEQAKMSRSISLPVKPNFSETEEKNLKRSAEKEKLYSETSENSMHYLYEKDELNDIDDDLHDYDINDDINIHHHKLQDTDNDKISLNLDTENVIMKRTPAQNIHSHNQSDNKNSNSRKNSKEIELQKRRRHSSGNGRPNLDYLLNNPTTSTTSNQNTNNKNNKINPSDTSIDISFIDDINTDTDYIMVKDDTPKNKQLCKKHNQNENILRNKEIIDDNDEDNNELGIFDGPSTSGGGAVGGGGAYSDGLNKSSSLKQRYKKDKRRTSNTRKTSVIGLGERKGSQGWFGSTIEVNNLEESNESCSYKDDDDNDDGIVEDRYIRRSISRNINRRLIKKDGHQNVSFKNIPRRSIRYWKDLITTLIELEWSYVLSMFVVIFVGSWILFAMLWYLIAKAHGDLDFDPLTGLRVGEGKKPCVHGAYDMTSMFIHSLELQTTIGFGEKYPTEECPEGVFLFVFQIISSIAFEGAIIAVVYAKMAKPVKLLSKFTFSKTACIYLRDGKFCFIFRVCDPREQKCIGTKIRAYLVADATTPEGETMKINTELKLEGDGSGIIIWPETVCHFIDKDSPFYKFTAIDFHTKNFEIFLSLVGHSPLTGQSTESRTSYLPHEILWGQRFPNIIDYNQIKQSYSVDYDNFHTTVAANIPFKSAYHLDRLKIC